MFGIFKTNSLLRSQLRACHARMDKNNATIQELRKLLNEERRKLEVLARSSAGIIAEMQLELGRASGKMAANMQIKPSPPQPLARNVIKMQSRTVAPTDAPINHGSSSPDLGLMMGAGMLMGDARPAEQQAEPPAAAPAAFSSGSGGDFGGGGASSSWSDSSSSSDSGSSDSSSSSSD